MLQTHNSTQFAASLLGYQRDLLHGIARSWSTMAKHPKSQRDKQASVAIGPWNLGAVAAILVTAVAVLASYWNQKPLSPPSAAKGPGAAESEFRELPDISMAVELKRDLGYLEPVQREQLEALIEVEAELTQLPVQCGVCRIAGLEAATVAVQLGLSLVSARTSSAGPVFENASDVAVRLAPTLSSLCQRIKRFRLLGVMRRRRTVLMRVCQALLATPDWRVHLSSLSSQLAMAAATTAVSGFRGTQIPPAHHMMAALCENVCPTGQQNHQASLARWPALLEAVLGREPIDAALYSDDSIIPSTLASSLLFFAAAKSDAQATRLLVALSGASASIVSQRGDGMAEKLAEGLVRLMSPPSIRQQLRLLQLIRPQALAPGVPEKEAYLKTIKARFKIRIDNDAVSNDINDTALHVAAYGYDHETLLALLIRDGGGPHVNTPDSLGRTALHYAADGVDQLAGLVNVFAEPKADIMTIAEQRTSSQTTQGIRMAADHPQNVVTDALSTAQSTTIKLLLAFGADPNVQAPVSGSSPLHLAARSGATAAVTLLITSGATLEARNRHGMTALAIAAAAGHSRTCAILIEAGARIDARDAHGHTVEWYASASGSAMNPVDAVSLFGVPPKAPINNDTGNQDDLITTGGWGKHDASSLAEIDSVDSFDFCEIDRIANTSSSSRFEADYLVPGRPVLLKHGADQMHAKHAWSRSKWFAHVGGEVFAAQKLPIWKNKLLQNSKDSSKTVTLSQCE